MSFSVCDFTCKNLQLSGGIWKDADKYIVKAELKNIGRSRKAADINIEFVINMISTLKVIPYATDNTYYVQNNLN